jgi:Rrf2 family protein
MRVSAKAEYACLAVLELAARFGSGEPVRIKTIADEHGIPARFLVQILLQLKGAGLVASTRGAAGGYQLIKPPAKISLGEVMAVIEGQEGDLKTAVSDQSATGKVLLDAWQEIASKQQHMLRSLTFDKLVERVRQQQEMMYYI